MFREMRRINQKLTQKACVDILKNNTSGVLALAGDDGYPYAVPLSYAYQGGKIYFHCAKTGHKLDAVANSGKASFCIIDKDEIIPNKYTTAYRSIIAFGKASVTADNEEILLALNLLAQKYSPLEKDKQKEIEKYLPGVCIIAFEIEHLSGKQAKELL